MRAWVLKTAIKDAVTVKLVFSDCVWAKKSGLCIEVVF